MLNSSAAAAAPPIPPAAILLPPLATAPALYGDAGMIMGMGLQLDDWPGESGPSVDEDLSLSALLPLLRISSARSSSVMTSNMLLLLLPAFALLLLLPTSISDIIMTAPRERRRVVLLLLRPNSHQAKHRSSFSHCALNAAKSQEREYWTEPRFVLGVYSGILRSIGGRNASANEN